MTNRNDMGAIMNVASKYFSTCRSQADRDDLIGEVALGWAEGLAKLDAEKSEKEQGVFLFTYARGYAQNWIRSRVRHFGQEFVASDESEVGDSMDPAHESFFERMTVAAVLDAVMGLPEKDRDVLVKRFHLGLSLDEIGQEMGISRERVRQIEARGLNRIRPLFKEV